MKREINIENWKRRDHFRFYSGFDEPFFGVTVKVRCQKAYDLCKREGHSFFLYYLHATLLAVNDVEAFRYRIQDGRVFLYETVDASPTINRPDGTFGFSYITYHRDFATFQSAAQIEVERVRQASGLEPASSSENVIHFTTLPWLNFTSMSHARHFTFDDSVPKIAFGKLHEADGALHMPVSVHVHHALVDGAHVGQFVDKLRARMD